jgi:hypothetical protein
MKGVQFDPKIAPVFKKLTRAELYEANMLGRQIEEWKVYSSIVSYSPTGLLKISPAKGKILEKWEKY